MSLEDQSKEKKKKKKKEPNVASDRKMRTPPTFVLPTPVRLKGNVPQRNMPVEANDKKSRAENAQREIFDFVGESLGIYSGSLKPLGIPHGAEGQLHQPHPPHPSILQRQPHDKEIYQHYPVEHTSSTASAKPPRRRTSVLHMDTSYTSESPMVSALSLQRLKSVASHQVRDAFHWKTATPKTMSSRKVHRKAVSSQTALEENPGISHQRVATTNSDMKVKIFSGLSDLDFGQDKGEELTNTFDNFNATYVRLPALSEGPGARRKVRSHANRLTLEDRLRRTVETRRDASQDAVSMLRRHFDEDRHQAFVKGRIPTLRRSPAYIKWPAPAAGRTLPPSHACGVKMTRREESEAELRAAKTKSLLRVKSGSEPTVSIAPDPSTSQFAGLHPWWEYTAFGSVRVDKHKTGPPRFYHWAPFDHQLVQEVRCRFKTPSLPPHQSPKAIGPKMATIKPSCLSLEADESMPEVRRRRSRSRRVSNVRARRSRNSFGIAPEFLKGFWKRRNSGGTC